MKDIKIKNSLFSYIAVSSDQGNPLILKRDQISQESVNNSTFKLWQESTAQESTKFDFGLYDTGIESKRQVLLSC